MQYQKIEDYLLYINGLRERFRIADLLPFCFYLFVFGVTFSIALAHIALGLWLVVWFFSLKKKQIPWRGTALDKAILIFLAIEVISAFGGINPKNSLLHIVSLWHISIY